MVLIREGVLKVDLTQVGYEGADVHCSNWDVVIELAVLENGENHEILPLFGVSVGPGNTPLNVNPVEELYLGPGGFCGIDTPEAILQFRISFTGTSAAGQLIQGAAEARIPHMSTDPNQRPPLHFPIDYCVAVPVTFPPQPPVPPPPRLWFNFSVESVC